MHTAVLTDELVQMLDVKGSGIYVDCTGGGGTHAAAVREKLTDGRLLVLDRDPEAIERLRERFSGDKRIEVVYDNFRNISQVLSDRGIAAVDGLYADFGVSNWQLSTPERGFSFRHDGELNMRMDPTSGESAKDVVNKYSEDLLGEIIYRYGEERFFKRIAHAIVTRRQVKPFTGTLDLAAVVKGAVPTKFHKPGFHPATQTFQALRIHVNAELVAIESLLREIEPCVAVGGRVAFISFHSLEDRLVKEYLARYQNPCTCPPEFPVCVCGKVRSFKLLTNKPVIPTEKEVKANPLARSAKLRGAERVYLG